MSPYFPTEEERRYVCPNCENTYQPTGAQCLVNHAPGTCCHEYETEVTEGIFAEKYTKGEKHE
jgi:hypothetical protein